MKDERETKEKLLQSARAEFLAKGYQGASLRSICKASGVTTGALYFFFKDKDDLFTSLVAPQLNTLKAMLTEHMRQELLGVTPPQLYAVIYAGVLACYLLIDLVLVRRLDRMTPAEVLKNRE